MVALGISYGGRSGTRTRTPALADLTAFEAAYLSYGSFRWNSANSEESICLSTLRPERRPCFLSAGPFSEHFQNMHEAWAALTFL